MSTSAAQLPPGPRMPVALSSAMYFLRPLPLLERCRRRYGDMFTLRLAQEGAFVIVSDPEAVRQVFTGDPRLLHAGAANKVLLPLVGPHSVLLLDEGAHMQQRKLMLPAFHGDRMKRFGDLMTSIATAEVESWPRGTPISIWPRMQAVTLEVIVRAVFGVQGRDRQRKLQARVSDMLGEVQTPSTSVLMMLLSPERLSKLSMVQRVLGPVDEMLYEEIRERRSADLGARDDILSMLMQARHEDGAPMSDVELRDELMTLLVAGHETTATALSWAVERLVHSPEKLRRLEREVADGEDAYLDAVIAETLRLRPIIPLVVRRTTEPIEIGGRPLPEGTTVAPCIHLVHRRPDVYPEPHRFLPERFLDNPPGTYTWIPFGGGVRRCLGASFAQFEMKAVLLTVLSQVRLRAAGSEPERIRRRTITLSPSRGGAVIVRPLAGRIDPEPAKELAA
jgi:cytochrome P450